MAPAQIQALGKIMGSTTPQLIFLHTEHTRHASGYPELAAIGLITEDGTRQFYAEVTDDCPRIECSRQFIAWLATFDSPVQLATDDIDNDWFLIETMLPDPDNNWPFPMLSKQPFVINNASEDGFESACWSVLNCQHDFAPDNLRQHHAMDEAIARRLAYSQGKNIRGVNMRPYATVIPVSAKALIDLAEAGALDNYDIFKRTQNIVIPDLVRYQLAASNQDPITLKILDWIQKNEGGKVLVSSTKSFEKFVHFAGLIDELDVKDHFILSSVTDAFEKCCARSNHKTAVLTENANKYFIFMPHQPHHLEYMEVKFFLGKSY
jgi:hypothetical protein